MSLNAFSQTDTNSTTIQLTKPIAQLVVKDLIKLDGLSVELKSTKELLYETNLKVDYQHNLIENLETQIINFQTIVDKKSSQLEVQSSLSSELQRELKKQKVQKKLFQIGTVVFGTGVIITYLVNP